MMWDPVAERTDERQSMSNARLVTLPQIGAQEYSVYDSQMNIQISNTLRLWKNNVLPPFTTVCDR